VRLLDLVASAQGALVIEGATVGWPRCRAFPTSRNAYATHLFDVCLAMMRQSCAHT